MKESNFDNLSFRLINEESTDPNYRSDFLRDRDRILFSRSFRRLAGKTQLVTVSGLKTSDHLRSRLTHSLEVMQIAYSIGKYIQSKKKIDININLIEAIALGHDLGHTPYGHVGERSLCDFFRVKCHKDFPKEKLKHNFQSIKICCFLERQYYPEYYGLNLTLSTLDGILKHSKIEEQDRAFYKNCFESYYLVFMEACADRTKINEDSYETMKFLFDYYSPITLEGAIVSIADEIAQISHDIEDMRRLTSLSEMLNYYNRVKTIIEGDLYGTKIVDVDLTSTYDDFLNTLKITSTNSDLEIKLERVYTKLILNLSIPLIGNIVNHLCSLPKENRLDCLKKHYTGSFKSLSELSKELSLDSGVQVALKCLSEIYKTYEETLYEIKEIARWDLKGKEMCDELVNKLYNTLSSKKDINLNIFERKSRHHLERSYLAGLKFGEKLGLDDSEKIAEKCLIWDYVAGMTDSFIIKEYETFSFKQVRI